VAKRLIDWYGISSNTLGTPDDLPSHVSAALCLDAATRVGANHHFRVVQLPLNLLETGPATRRVEGEQTVLEFARARGLGVLTNRPLNAILDGRLIRLAEEEPVSTDVPPLAEALARLAGQEEEFKSKFDFPLLGGGAGASGWLAPLREQLPSLEEFRTVIGQEFTPAANTWLLNADHTLQSDPRYAAWRKEFAIQLDSAILALQNETARSLSRREQSVRQALSRAGVDLPLHSLSQLALATLLGLEGVSCVLNGMRKPSYVDDSIGAIELEITNATRVLEQVAGSIDGEPF
jgi:hypothetical protein